MKNRSAIVTVLFALAMLGAVPEFGHAAVTVATGHITYGSLVGSTVLTDEAAYIAGGCAKDVPSANFQAMIDIRAYQGRMLVLTATKTGTRLRGDHMPTSVHAYAAPECSAAAMGGPLVGGQYSVGTAESGAPARFRASGFFLVLTNADATFEHQDEYYRLEAL